MPIRIFKGKKRRRGTKVRPSRARDEALQQQMENGVEISLSKGIRSMQAEVDADTLAQAYMDKDYSKLMRQIPMEKVRKTLKATGEKIGGAVVAGAKENKSIGSLKGFRYDLSNPRVAQYMDGRTGALIENVKDQFQEFVGGLIKRKFAYGTATEDVASAMLTRAGRSKTAGFVLKYGLGLDSRSAAALARRTESGDYTKAQLKAYESDLHVRRAQRIARTETAYAMNAGQLEVWNEAKEQGLIDEQAMKVWTVDGNPCDQCVQMDGVAVPLDEPFILPDGSEILTPPAHPCCLCIAQLQTGADEEAPENRE